MVFIQKSMWSPHGSYMNFSTWIWYTWYPRGFFHVILTTWRPRGSHIDFETYTVRHKNVVKKVRQKVFKEYTKLYNFKN